MPAPKFLLAFEIGNSAFDDNAEAECARILREVAGKLEQGIMEAPLFDANGNRIGRFQLEERE